MTTLEELQDIDELYVEEVSFPARMHTVAGEADTQNAKQFQSLQFSVISYCVAC